MAGPCTNFFQKRVCCWVSRGKEKFAITYAWLAALLLVFVAFICACVAAANMSKSRTVADAQASQVASFAAVWTALLMVGFSVFGTIAMIKREVTPLVVGVILGVLFIMCQQMLIIFAIFVDRSKIPGESMSVVASQQAVAVFAFFLFIVYAGFGILLATFRDAGLSKETDVDVEEQSVNPNDDVPDEEDV